MKRFIAALMAACLLTVSAFAQTSTGRLIGTVSSPDGVLPGATVVVKNNQTEKEQTVTTNDDGTFVLPQLEVGTYTVTITGTGFKTYVATELKIDVGREYSLNPTLEIGGVTESVTVTAGADIVNSTSPQLSNTVSPQQILNLPLNGRNPIELVRLQAGTQSNNFQATTINGMRTTFTNITRDGINIQDAFIRTNATDFVPGRPSVDDTGEFTISAGNSGSDTGYGGAQVSLVTPRGESSYHGALFAYNRNSKFAANNFFNNRAGSFGPNDAAVLQGRAVAGAPRIPRPFRNRNQYGGKFSGPLPLPRLGEGGPILLKDKAFFFFNYEGLIDPVSSLATRTILTPTARAGTFQFNRTTAGAANAICPSGAVGSVCSVPNILAFASSVGLAGVPTSIDPVVQSRILSQLPAVGNRTDIGDQLNTTGFAINRRSNQERDIYTSRFDVDVNAENSVSFVYSYNNELNLRPDVDTNGFGVTPAVDQTSTNKTLALAYRRTLTSNFVNEVRGGYLKSFVPFNRNIERPGFFVTPTLITSPETQFLDQGRKTGAYNIQDNADLIVSNHSLRFGGIFQFFQVDAYNDALILPVYTLGTGAATPQFVAGNFTSVGGISNAQLATANGLFALLGGIVNGGSQQFNTTSRTSGFSPTRLFQPFRYENHSLYVQDRWRIRPELTLTLGVRYELFPALRLDNGLALEPVIPDGVDPVQAILDPRGTYDFIGTNSGRENAYYKTDKNNFAPSFGFAYSPQFKNKLLGAVFGEAGRTVIRGGYSSVYGNDSIVTTINNAAINNVGIGRTASNALNAAGTSTAINDRLSGALTPINPPTFITPPRTFLQNNAPNVGGNFGTVFAVDPNIQVPRVDQYSIGIQRELGFQTALEIRYVGTRSSNLARSIDYNQVDIFNNGFLADFERARANLALTGNAFCATAGCQALTIFRAAGAGVTPGPGRLIVGTGGLQLATFNSNLTNGTPADLAIGFVSNGFNGGPTVANPTNPVFINFLPNPGTGVANLFTNGAKYHYDSLQVEVRRRFSKGLYLQGNYTFSKNLTNAIGTSQQLVEPFLDINNPDLDKQRADFDQTHVFNFNSIYELPFGKGKPFFGNAGGILDRIIGGFELSTIVSYTSGPPITFVDTRGTLNRTGRSGRQTVNSALSGDEIRNLVGRFETARGIYYINPAVVDPATGRASNGFGSTPFSGQVFFNTNPGQTGNLARTLIDGPNFFNLNASLIKNIRIGETSRIQLRMEAFNALNNVNFNSGTQFENIQSTTFGQLTSASAARVMQFAARFEF